MPTQLGVPGERGGIRGGRVTQPVEFVVDGERVLPHVARSDVAVQRGGGVQRHHRPTVDLIGGTTGNQPSSGPIGGHRAGGVAEQLARGRDGRYDGDLLRAGVLLRVDRGAGHLPGR